MLSVESEKKNDDTRAPENISIRISETNKEMRLVVFEKIIFKKLIPCLFNLFTYILDWPLNIVPI